MEHHTDGSLERWNTHFSTTVEQEVFGMTFRLSQDPNSQHLGTTVWDASIVLAKYLQKHAGKGDLSRPKLKHKQCIELGAGSGGLAGMAFAALGCQRVALTDVAAVLPLLRHNAQVNISPSALKASGSHLVGQLATVDVCELDWLKPEQWTSAGGPFDYVLAADCVYEEGLVEHLVSVVEAVASPRATVLIANELRSESVQAAFLRAFGRGWVVKRVSHSKLDPKYRHPLIHLYSLRRRRAKREGEEEDAEVEPEEVVGKEDKEEECRDEKQQGKQANVAPLQEADVWETRRLGAALAASLADVQVPEKQIEE